MSDISYDRFEDTNLYKNGRSMLAVFLNCTKDKFSLSEAVGEPLASFVYSDVEIKKKEDADALLERCKNALVEKGSERGIIWLTETLETVAGFNLNNKREILFDFFETIISGDELNNIKIKIPNGTKAEFKEDIFVFSESGKFSFGNLYVKFTAFDLHFTPCGTKAGTISVKMNMPLSEFTKFSRCGNEYGFVNTKQVVKLISNNVFADFQHSDVQVKFEFGFNVLSDNIMRFEKSVTIPSNLTSYYGDKVYLTPIIDGEYTGGITFLSRISDDVCSSLIGKYKALIENDKELKILCGFSGTEYIMPNDGIIEFVPKKPAFSPYFPEREFSMMDFVEPPPKNLLNSDMVTSWVKFKGKYFSQPLESPFFTGDGDILALAELYTDFSNGSPAMPIMSYVGLSIKEELDKTQIRDFERAILMAERNNCVNEYTYKNKNDRLFLATVNATETTAATPTGFVGRVKGNSFDKISVGFSQIGDLSFEGNIEQIQAAFFSSSMFCVIANSDNTGTFNNKLNIGEWNFELSPDKDSEYNNYANILIIKSVQGKIYEPDPENQNTCLCGNPNLWTCKESFSNPVKGEYANLANWILRYCKEAYEKYNNGKGEIYYKEFVRVITDENWKGFLALNVSLDTVAFPDCLAPLLAGVSDVSKIRTHHVGADLVALKSSAHGPVNDGLSPFFGLINYKADGFFGNAVPIDNTSALYEFKLLKMNVLFEKGAVRDFNSLSQLVVSKFMSLNPSESSCLYNALLLNGTLQTSEDEHSVLMMTSDGGEFIFENAPLTKTTVTGITVVSVNPKEMKFAFDVSGVMCFKKCEDGIDVFSYESLMFSYYRLNLSKGVFSIDLTVMQFDLSNSQIRDKSFCQTFAISPVSADISSDITKDFKAIAAEGLRNSSLSDGAVGIEAPVNLGGLGSLSDDTMLMARIIFAWDGDGNQFVGIKLPGVSMIDSVIGLTLGEASLRVTESGSLVMYISKASLELLGLLKLPLSGSVNLALIGNGDGIGWYAEYRKDEVKKLVQIQECEI